jgi:hypothetical protein
MSGIKMEICHKCKHDLTRIYFLQHEYDDNNIKTGRVRNAVSHLLCENCGHQEIIDDSMDGPWYFERSIK